MGQLVEVLGMSTILTYLVAAALAFGAGWTVQGWRYGEKLTELKQEHADEALSAARSALKMTEIFQEKADAALREAEARASRNQRDAARLRAELDGMRRDFAEVPDRIRSATREAVDQYAATVTGVFERCVRRYSELAARADGHASDVQTLSDAWPPAPAKDHQ